MEQIIDGGVYVFDVESDGLIDEITKIYCLSYHELKSGVSKTITDYEEIKQFFNNEASTIIGHNIYLYDVPAVEKVLGIKVKYKNIVDTLALSHYIHSSKPTSYKHGLEAYGERFGVSKTKVSQEQWSGEGMDVEEHLQLMKTRCKVDIEINLKLWLEQQEYLFELYDGDEVEIKRLLGYINSKLDVLLEQQNNPLKLDIELVNSEIDRLEILVAEKREPLREAMPKLSIKQKITKPKNTHKADGSLSVVGKKWYDTLETEGLPLDYEDDFEVIKGYTEPNPDSTQQLKEWLYSLGWQPIHFKFTRNKITNEFNQVPQIKSEYDDTDICTSIKELVEQEPAIEHLASYSTIKHRLTIYKGFLRDKNTDDTITAEANFFTNTMRLKHRKIVNIPKPSAPYSENIRASIIAKEGGYLVSADLSGIEDATKQHYLYTYDPEYVDSMRTDDWDAHLDIALRAELLTEEQVAEHKAGTTLYKEERQAAKTVNFSSTYKVGSKTLARNLKKSEKFAKSILDAFWKRNWAIKAFEKDCITKLVRGQMWVQQPVSRFWYTLRSEKDIFSTVNQATAVYVFDVWLAYLRKQSIKISMQMHDEFSSNLLKNKDLQPLVEEKIYLAMSKVNDKLKLNVEIGCSLAFGQNYKDIH